MSIRQVIEGVLEQGPDEEVAWNITTTPWGSSPTDVEVTAYDESVDEDVTGTVFDPNSPSVVEDVITLSRLKALTLGHSYRIEVKFTDADSDIWEPYFRVKCIV